MDSSFDTYKWVKQDRVWKLESTSEDGKKTLLPDGVIPARAPSRFDHSPDHEEWKKSMVKSKDSGQEISAR
jgi:hypothetical protein